MRTTKTDTSTVLGLSLGEFEIVTSLLEKYVADRPSWAFGSRTFRRARRRSDLDIAIGGNDPLPLLTRVSLEEAFDVSALPIEVDVVDLHDVTPEFRKRIEPDFVALIEVHQSAELRDGSKHGKQ